MHIRWCVCSPSFVHSVTEICVFGDVRHSWPHDFKTKIFMSHRCILVRSHIMRSKCYSRKVHNVCGCFYFLLWLPRFSFISSCCLSKLFSNVRILKIFHSSTQFACVHIYFFYKCEINLFTLINYIFSIQLPTSYCWASAPENK